MPTKREREYYQMGFRDGFNVAQGGSPVGVASHQVSSILDPLRGGTIVKRKRKLSPWNKFVKANSRKPRFIYKSGSNKVKLNLKKMGVAFRKTPAGKRKK